MTIHDQILEAKRNFFRKFNEHPENIYLGINEHQDIKTTAHKLYEYCEPKEGRPCEKILGMYVYRVDAKSHLKLA